MSAWDVANVILWSVMSIMMLYQIIFLIIGFFANKKYPDAKKEHTYAFLIAGRNEEKVIGQLLDSIKKQNYDLSKIKVFVCADNCSPNDRTAEIVCDHGFIVYERHDQTKIGKSYALDFLMQNITRDFPTYKPDGYFIFDADNVLDVNYIKEMNKAFDSGEKIVTSYRASKNYGESLMSMGSSIHFVRECRFTHTPRNLLNLSTHVSGTGFLVSSEVLNIKDGWKYGKLTEDLEFSCDNLIKGNKVAYCDTAIFYDEQPVSVKQTYRQRLRWQKGTYQCFSAFSFSLFVKIFSKMNFAFYDFWVFFFPLPLISTSWALVNGLVNTIESILLIISGAEVIPVLATLAVALIRFFAILYFSLFVYGSLAVVKDWKRIKATKKQKILSMFAYPLFMIAIIPIPFISFFKKIEWKPINHTYSKSVEELSGEKSAEQK